MQDFLYRGAPIALADDPAASPAEHGYAVVLEGLAKTARADRRSLPADAEGTARTAITEDGTPTDGKQRTRPAMPHRPPHHAGPDPIPRLRTELWPGEGRPGSTPLPIRILHAAKDQLIYAEGDPAEFCYRILDGGVRIVKLMDDGRRQVTEFLLPGDMLGLDAFDAHDITAEAVVATTLHCYRRAAVEALADHDPAVARRLRSFTANSLRVARERMMLLGRKTAVERIATFLLEMTVRSRPVHRDHVVLPMGRADIADHLGLTVETVCRVLASLRESGTIGPTMGRESGISILDPATLRALACGMPCRTHTERRAGADSAAPTAASGNHFERQRTSAHMSG